MAAAEARAAWQRAANRCFVQEDAKRAPKLACCQSSTLLSKQSHSGPANTGDDPDHPAVGFMPFSRIPSYLDLPPDAKWWLQMQLNHGHQRGLNFEHFNTRMADVETFPPAIMNPDSQVGEIADVESLLDLKKHPESKLGELNSLGGKVDRDFLDLKNMTDYYDFLEMEMVGGSISEREFSRVDDSSSWVEGEKVPWWHVTDGEELASFVAQKSLHRIQNCDLPPPQKMHVREENKQAKTIIDHDEIFMSSLDWEAQRDTISSQSSGGLQREKWPIVNEGQSRNAKAASEPLSDAAEKGRISIGHPTKARLLEALCHSQTRAREAEEAAKQAYSDKEHILTLFFRQASQLFAYKQWFKLLQLDSNSSPLTASACDSPDFPPWMPLKPRKMRKSFQKLARAKRHSKRGSRGNDIAKYGVAFALGFTLVGAGLILGWTLGCLRG